MTQGLLLHAPTGDELARLYHELALRGAPSVGAPSDWPYSIESDEHLFVLAAEMLRYDARLLSILLQWTLQRWRSLDPLAIRTWMHRQRWPQALAVVLSFAREAARGEPELIYWIEYVSAGWPRVDPPERFFIDAERPGSRLAQARLGRALKPYSRWGFLGTERPTTNVFTKETVGRYDAATRRRIAHELAESRGTISVTEYLDAVGHSVTRSQAAADLRAAGLVVIGSRRGARWRLARARTPKR
ncbi:MAG: hypothetical protein K8H88_32810 [Sandaracinaceae bacterium]|nr:hypothetical protein [Sandaracinaceae bacterium]